MTLVENAGSRGSQIYQEAAGFLAGCEMFLREVSPDLLWTYGGDPVAMIVQDIAKRQGIPIVFALHNFSYRDAAPFDMVDGIIVPTEIPVG